jgi:integrase
MPRPAKPRLHRTHGRWYAAIGERDRKGRAGEVYAPPSVRTEAEAWKWFDAEVARRAAEVAPIDPTAVTVDWVCEHYLAWAEGRFNEGKLSETHHTNKGYHLGLFSDSLGARVARTLEVGDMEAFVGLLQTRYSPNYVANICSTVSAALNWAVRAKHLDANPVKGFESPSVPKAPERFAERAEAAVFLRHWLRRSDRKSVTGRYDRLTLLLERILIRTGSRPGELCALWWSDIRWEAGTTAGGGHAFAKAIIPAERHKTGGKTGKPRTIYLTPLLTRAIRREYERPGRHPVHVFTHGRGKGGKGAGEPWESGSRLSKTILKVRRELIKEQEAIREKMKQGAATTKFEARKVAVEIKDSGHDRLTNYRWRHTAISTLLMLGVDVPTVAELTGTSPDMIYRIYGHLLDSHLQAAAEKLSGGGRRDRPRPGSAPGQPAAS